MKRNNFDDPYKEMPVERFRFDKELIGIAGRIPRRVLEDLPGGKLETYVEEYTRDLVVKLTHRVAFGDKVLKEEIEVPKTWKDHLKHDLNSWAWSRITGNHFFFTNIAKAIIAFKLTPCFRTIPVVTQTVRNYCPHVSNGDNMPHIEFLLQRPFGESFHG